MVREAGSTRTGSPSSQANDRANSEEVGNMALRTETDSKQRSLWRQALAALLSLCLMASPTWQTAHAKIESFRWSNELSKARDAYEIVIQNEQDARKRFEEADEELQQANLRYTEALAEIGWREKEWRGNLALAKRHQSKMRKINDAFAELERKIGYAQARIESLNAEIAKVEAEPISLAYYQDAKIRELKGELQTAKAEFTASKRAMKPLSEEREDEIASYDARQTKLRPSVDIYAQIIAAADALTQVRSRHGEAAATYENARKNVPPATLDYFSRLENTRPPYVQSVVIKHGRRTIYDAQWKPVSSGEESSGIENTIVRDTLARERNIHTLSLQRIEILERNRTILRKHMNAARDEAQAYQIAIANTLTNEVHAKIALELAVIGAEIALTGGALTVATGVASLSVERAVKAYSKEYAEKFAEKALASDKLIKILVKLDAIATAKLLEDRITQSYVDRRYSGIGKDIGSEVTEWAFGEAIGAALDRLHSGMAKQAGQAAMESAARRGTSNAAVRNMTSAANASVMKASLGVAVAEIIGKVAVSYGARNVLEFYGNRKVAKQVEVFVTQYQWNKVHVALLQERLRAERISARIAALEMRLELGRLAYELDIRVDETLTTKDIEGKHNIDIFFETSERLELPPTIEKLAGFEPQGFERDPRRGENWWKAFAVLDEEQLGGRFDLPITIKKDETLNPYGELDSNPGTSPKLVNLQDPSWDGFEPGADRNHAIRLQEQPDYVCALPESASKQSDSNTIVAGIVPQNALTDCSYWGVPGFGVLAMQHNGDEFSLEWVKTFKYEPTSQYDLTEHGASTLTWRHQPGIQYWDFEKGPFIKARLVPPPSDDDIWDYNHFVLTGSAKATINRHCGMRDAPEKYTKQTLNETIYVLVSPYITRRYDVNLIGRGELKIVFDRSEMFKRETVYTVYPSDNYTERYIGIPDCVRQLYPSTPPPYTLGGVSLDFQENTSTPKSGRIEIYARRLDAGVSLDDIKIDNLEELTSDETLEFGSYDPNTLQERTELINRVLETGEHPSETRYRQFIMSVDDYIPFTGAEWDGVKRSQDSLNE